MGIACEDLIVYQIYPKSFYDKNKDGIGDLNGIIEKLPYLKQLGVNMIWLNPIFKSPQIDNGYDVSDYRQIDTMFGTNEDMENLIKKAHQYGIRVIFDLVLNHTSDQHEWFLQAKQSKDNPYRDYYLWENPNPKTGKEPNNWASFFGGSTWEKIDEQYYFHLFAKEMPDLNWRNPKVRKEMVDVAKFWLEKGVDGFRVDAFIHVAKQAGYPNMPTTNKAFVLAEKYYANLPEVNLWMKEFVDEIKKDYPNAYFVGEASSANAEQGYGYTNHESGFFDSVITFRYFHEDNSEKDPRLNGQYQRGQLVIKQLKKVMSQWQDALQHENPPVLYWNNHDMVRIVSRIRVDHLYRKQLATSYATAMYLQRGIPFIYYGEEIGMRNFLLETVEDCIDESVHVYAQKARQLGYRDDFILSNISYGLRDTARGMMQWGAQKQDGWTQSNGEAVYNVEEQIVDNQSIFHYYKRLLEWKQIPLFKKGKWELLDTEDTLYVYRRTLDKESAIVICNLSEHQQVFEAKGTVLLSNVNSKQYTGVLQPYEAIVLKEEE